MERRKSPRSPVDREVAARIPATPMVARILDMSTSGCLAEAHSPLIREGRTILLNLSGTDEITGTIAWQEGDRVGIKFLEEISQETLSRVLKSDGGESQENTTMRDRFGRALPPLAANFRFL